MKVAATHRNGAVFEQNKDDRLTDGEPGVAGMWKNVGKCDYDEKLTKIDLRLDLKIAKEKNW